MNSTTSNISFKSPNLYLQEDMQISVIEEIVFEKSGTKVDARHMKKPSYEYASYYMDMRVSNI